MSALRMFIPLTKVDAETRTVYGIATGETVDRSGEVCDYATTKPLYEAWSGDIAKASGGKSLGNLRAMHGKVAAGKVTNITFNDAAKQIEVAAKVVDDNEWAKVVEGVYTGFSQGGAYAKRWRDDATGLQRYTADPHEISLVDLPCLPSATFQMVKAAGVTEQRTFAKAVQVEPAAPTNAEVNAKAIELAKAAGREAAVADFFESAREALVKAALPPPAEAPAAADAGPGQASGSPRETDGVEQVWKAKDGSTHAKKADALAKNAELEAAAAVEPGTKPVLDAIAAITDKLGLDKADKKWTVSSKKDGKTKTTEHESEGAAVDEARSRDGAGHSDVICRHGDEGMVSWKKEADKAATADDLAKGLWTVARFADLLAALRELQVDETWQATVRGNDANGSIAAIKAWVTSGCALLVTMIQEEANDIMPDLVDDDALVVLAMAAGAKLDSKALGSLGKIAADLPRLAKLLPEMIKAGARNSKSDMAKIQAMHDNACELGATCKGGADKAVDGGDLAKALDVMKAERDAAATERDLAKAERVALQKAIYEQIVPKLNLILAQPMPMGTTHVASKAVAAADADDLAGQLAKMKAADPDAYTLLMIKTQQQSPRPIAHLG